ncbi:protease inhibitor I42 family protein [Candidatus Parcubacteria bacterium]|nr:protease inhibitor I42 family protein [Candidatus Parcubacteria bacterium]
MNPKRLLTALLILILGAGSFILLTKPVTSPIEPIEIAQIAETPTPPESEVDEVTQPLNSAVGEEFTIRLEANATTGYSWEVTYDEEYLELTDQDYETEASPEIVGAGGRAVFTFQALTVGETEITFSYSRPWEEEILETRIFTALIE